MQEAGSAAHAERWQTRVYAAVTCESSEGDYDLIGISPAVTLSSRSKAGLVNGVMRNLLRRQIVWDEAPLPGAPKWLRNKTTQRFER